MTRRHAFTLGLGVTLVLFVLGCATSPTGRNQLLFQSEPEMAVMGVAAFEEMKTQLPRSTNTAQRRLVQCVADSITSVLTAEDLGEVVVDRWEVELFDDPSANAFALPGGKMGVHTGLLDVAKNPSQLAAVMGHEVGHVLARHGNERVSGQTVAQVGMTAATILAGEESEEKGMLMAALGLGTQMGLMKFSRTHESEADLIGLRLMARAGFDPSESVTLWQNMGAAAGGQSPPEFMSTHPSHTTRISDLKSNMAEAQAIYQQRVAAGRRAQCR